MALLLSVSWFWPSSITREQAGASAGVGGTWGLIVFGVFRIFPQKKPFFPRHPGKKRHKNIPYRKDGQTSSKFQRAKGALQWGESTNDPSEIDTLSMYIQNVKALINLCIGISHYCNNAV